MSKFGMLAIVMVGFLATSVVAAPKTVTSSADDVDLTTICDDFPHLPACEEALMNSLEKLEKRKSAYTRFGRSSGGIEGVENAMNGLMEKRKSVYMRFGKRSGTFEDEVTEPEIEKRKSAYMRFEKRSVEDFDKASIYNGLLTPVEKRKSAYMRFGK